MPLAPRHRPFPWGSLDVTTQAEAALLRDVRRWIAGVVPAQAWTAVMHDILGARVEILTRRFDADEPSIRDGHVGVLLRADRGGDPPSFVLVEGEPALAAAVVARAIRRPPLSVPYPRELSPALAGAFAATLAAGLRRSRGGATFAVDQAGPAQRLSAELAARSTDLAALSATVLLDEDAFAARLTFSRHDVSVAPDPCWTARELAAMGGPRLALPVVACAFHAAAGEIAATRIGDVLVLEGWSLGVSPGGSWTGRTWLAAPSADEGIRAQLGEQGSLVLGGTLEALCAAEETMAGAEEGDALVSAVGDIPVIVRVEIGEATMAARDWATLAPGDVIALGRRVGERVSVRVGGVVVARGELVDIEGQIGVRLTERIRQEWAAL